MRSWWILRFFSGFGFDSERVLFEPFLPTYSAGFTVAGFSLGAIRAFEHTLASTDRIERLILLSPAYFEQRTEGFKRQQLAGFKRDPKRYFESFYAACDLGSLDVEPFKSPGQMADLEFLLRYEWDFERLRALVSSGVRVSVYLGGQDRIMDGGEAAARFAKVCEVYFFKNAGHFLQEVRDG